MSTLTLCLLIWLVGLLPFSIAVGMLLASRSKMYPKAEAIEHRPVLVLTDAVPA